MIHRPCDSRNRPEVDTARGGEVTTGESVRKARQAAWRQIVSFTSGAWLPSIALFYDRSLLRSLSSTKVIFRGAVGCESSLFLC